MLPGTKGLAARAGTDPGGGCATGAGELAVTGGDAGLGPKDPVDDLRKGNWSPRGGTVRNAAGPAGGPDGATGPGVGEGAGADCAAGAGAGRPEGAAAWEARG